MWRWPRQQWPPAPGSASRSFLGWSMLIQAHSSIPMRGAPGRVPPRPGAWAQLLQFGQLVLPAGTASRSGSTPRPRSFLHRVAGQCSWPLTRTCWSMMLPGSPWGHGELLPISVLDGLLPRVLFGSVRLCPALPHQDLPDARHCTAETSRHHPSLLLGSGPGGALPMAGRRGALRLNTLFLSAAGSMPCPIGRTGLHPPRWSLRGAHGGGISSRAPDHGERRGRSPMPQGHRPGPQLPGSDVAGIVPANSTRPGRKALMVAEFVELPEYAATDRGCRAGSSSGNDVTPFGGGQVASLALTATRRSRVPWSGAPWRKLIPGPPGQG